MTQPNPFEDFLEENPEFLLEGAIGQQPNQSANRQSFFRNKFNAIFGQFQGELSRQILSGDDPTLRFSDFLEGDTPDQFSFQNFAAGFSPSDRGESTARFAPRTRFLFN